MGSQGLAAIHDEHRYPDRSILRPGAETRNLR